MKALLLTAALLIALARAAPLQDLMPKIPGFPASYKTAGYSGYLKLNSSIRATHYVFLESVKGKNNNDPVTLWLNGGPGCSSMLGYLQEIGPYQLADGANYKVGDTLTENKYSWHTASNLLFFESPAGVGYSYNLDKNFKYNDTQTASDNMFSLLDFFDKFPEYKSSPFWIAGQSYAGKYIPDLAVLIDKHNKAGGNINFKGILVGNGVMTFDYLQESTYEFLMDRNFVDPFLVKEWKQFCQLTPDDNKCNDACDKIDDLTDSINPYEVYGYCFVGDIIDSNGKPRRKFQSQEGILNQIKRQVSQGRPQIPKFNGGAPCAFFDGVYNYFNLHAVEYHAKFSGQVWDGPCAGDVAYTIDLTGSIKEYDYLLNSASKSYQIVIYNGNWDAVVPFLDTIKGFRVLNLTQSAEEQPWFTENQHSGFVSSYSSRNGKLTFVTVKGASHQVPEAKRPESLNLFRSVLAGKPLQSEEQSEVNLASE